VDKEGNMTYQKYYRILCACLLAAILATIVWVLHRCALSKEEVARRDAAATDVDWASVVDNPSERLTIHWLGMPNPGGVDGGWIEEQLEARFNVELCPVILDYKGYSTKKPLMFAAGDVPDVILENDPIVLQRDAFHGFLLDIPYEVLREHAPHYVRDLNDNAPIGWLYAYWNGRNYGLPTWQEGGGLSVPGVWRADWLQAVGIDEVPETLEEMHEAFRRFTFDDPDGNGVQDTFGFSGDAQSWWWASFQDIFGAYGVTPYDWQVTDGRVAWGGVLPEAKEALALLRQWYAEGLLDPEFVTDTYGSGKSLDRKLLNGVIGYRAFSAYFNYFDSSNPAGMNNMLQKLNPKGRFVPGKFPIGPGGRRGGRVWGKGGWIIAFGKHLKDQPEKVVRVLHMLDAMVVDEDLFLATKYGQRGVHWDYRLPEVGPSGGLMPLPPYDDANQAQQAMLRFYNPGENAKFYMKYKTQRKLDFMRQHQNPKWSLTDALGKPDVVPSASQYMGDLRGRQMTVYAEIIRGDKSLEAFDAFVEEWHSRGGEVMTKEANDMYRMRETIYRQVGVNPQTLEAPNEHP
jgi:putative aldouronate transport system substrate-binding protein